MAKDWRIAESLKTLRKEIDAYAPTRSKISDGSIGDVRHQKAGTSDHLPNAERVVTAIDVTNDEQAFPAQALVDALYRSKDKRVKYVISNKKISIQPFGSGWKDYHGANAHQHHVHISVSTDAKLYDDPKAWNLAFGEIKPTPKPTTPAAPPAPMPPTYTVKSGDTVSAICKRFGLKTVEFYQKNNLHHETFNPDKIKVGDIFKV